MKLFEGKTQSEKIKIVVAAVLGVLAVFFLYLAFGQGMFGGKTGAKTTSSPTPKPSPSATPDAAALNLPNVDEQNLVYQVTPIAYNGGTASAPDPGRNIFAFFEPPKPTPYLATPEPLPKVSPPKPEPTPNVFISVNPSGVYAGTKAFRMDITGNTFTPDMRIYFQGSEMPTSFISNQQIATDIPANFIAQEGARIIEVRTPDGKFWSNQVSFSVQAPPRPQFQYIGMIARKRGNNDTAYFQENGKPVPFSARLNDILGGRFRLISISSGETIFEDTSLGFKHKVALFKPPPGTSTGSGGRTSFPQNDFNPQTMPNPFPNPNQMPENPPGIPANIPRFQPQQPANVQQKRPAETKKDVDDDDDDGDN